MNLWMKVSIGKLKFSDEHPKKNRSFKPGINVNECGKMYVAITAKKEKYWGKKYYYRARLKVFQKSDAKNAQKNFSAFSRPLKKAKKVMLKWCRTEPK